ncbi:MAG: hypothetical protein LBP64_07685 [Tannerella sp.]|jgi:hypothetical protein|nr:hypothetical protein [Tannerella sp.]
MNHASVEKVFKSSVSDIFRNKGTVASIAEKSNNNLSTKSNSFENLYYFAVQHSFKQINRQKLFKIDEKTSLPTDYQSLDFAYFKKISNELEEIISCLRNLNAHFFHSFEAVKEDVISKNTLEFLKESFRLAVVQSYINEKINEIADRQTGTPLTSVRKDEIIDKCLKEKHNIVYFLKTMFYQKFYMIKEGETKNDLKKRQEENKEIIEFVDDQFDTLDKAVDFILFIEAKKDIVWELNANGDSTENNHKRELMTIAKGRYLSFNAMLFMLSMFLYKNEANALIPKISGFKKNGTPEDKRKLNVFLFYSKKFSSQDINNEDKKLIFFRDIMQYLGKYPLDWNKALEGNETGILNEFKNAIYLQEIERQFPALKDNADFKQFALGYLFRKGKINVKINNWGLWRDIIDKESKIIDVYEDIKSNNLKARSYKKNDHYDYYVLKYLIENYFPDKAGLVSQNVIDKRNKHAEKFNQNENTQRLKNRIANNLIISSYARNKDRFLEFGIRYLAANNYFGEQAQFKMYKYHSSIEQHGIYEILDSKARDKLKFKGGKEVAYKTYATSIQKYPDWDTPFVVENNAVFVKLNKDKRPFAIQRDLMIYFLENALYPENPPIKISDYFGELDKEKSSAVAFLDKNPIDKEQKNRLKKILPRHLLNNYLAAERNDNNVIVNSLQDILDHAEKQEKRYKHLREKAIYLDQLQKEHPMKTEIEKSREALFDDKNKGKNFKLTFIRKACHLMYFKDIYDEKVKRTKQEEPSEQTGHHKSFHITRGEYNNFCKWMYAFDAVPYYKQQLIDLFSSKGFFKNEDFREIIEDSDNLNDICEKVKQKYREWLVTNKDTVRKREYSVDSYRELLNNGVRYINISHFRQFLAKNGALQYRSLENKAHLVAAYYIEKPADETQKKLWNNLQKARHEDCLLYKLALRYFEGDKTVTQYARDLAVDEILCSVLEFQQEYEIGGQRNTYTVLVPIKDVDKWIELQKFDDKKTLLQRLPLYLQKNRNTKELKDIVRKFDAPEKRIALSDLSIVNNHIINNQAKFTCCIMALEEFYIWKSLPEKYLKNLKINEKTKAKRLVLENIPELKDYPGMKNRNNAFHFDLPMDKSYRDVFTEIEKRFAEEISKKWTVETLPHMHKNVLEVFIKKMRNDIFDTSIVYKTSKSGVLTKKTDTAETRKKALKKYLKVLQQQFPDRRACDCNT